MLLSILENGIYKKIATGILKFVSMLLLIFGKGISKETVPGILRFVSMLFQYSKRE